LTGGLFTITTTNIALCIPTRNAGAHFPELLQALREQTLQVEKLLVIDSSSTDGTPDLAQKYGVQVRIIPAADFNHGGTRNLALRWVKADIYIFLTQDILPADCHTMEHLIKPFGLHQQVGLAYARQLPRPGAGPIEAFSRFFTYPETSQLKKRSDKFHLGVRTVHCSNACAAYRREALEKVGGFPENVIMCEDVYVAARIINLGYQIAYAADAQVYHSHDYSIWQEFRRYFDNGVFYGSRERWIADEFGRTGSEGLKFFRDGYHYFIQKGQGDLIPEWFIRTLAKFCAYQLGAMERYLPILFKKQLSMHQAYWDKNI
jgi:rhamnosyltransferase